MIIKRVFKPAKFALEFAAAMLNPERVQERILFKILRNNKDTEYGKRFDFRKIKSIKNFQKNVPIIDYDDILPEIEVMKKGKRNVLVKDKVLFFAVSSGTTSSPKFIPITKKRMEFYRGELFLWAMSKGGTKMLKGKTLYFAAGDLIGHTKGKIPYGNITGYLVKNASKVIKRKLIVDSDTLNMKNFSRKMKKIAILALMEKNLTHIAFASAVQGILFFDFLKKNEKKLIREVRKHNKTRANYLENLVDFKPITIWPNLWVINSLKTNSNKIYLETVKEKLGKINMVVKDNGIFASEGRISVGLDDVDGEGIIPANETFFEFCEKRGKDFLKPITIGKLKKNKEYKVIMTTQEGLYRYDIKDVVKVVGFSGKLPVVKFSERNKFLNITEEHAPEGEIVRGVKEGLKKLKVKFRSFTVIPFIVKNKKPKYEILIEPFKKIDEEIAKNLLKEIDLLWQKYMLTYGETRNEFGRMDPPILSIVKKGNYDKIDSEILAKKGQAKPVNVTENLKFREKFEVVESYS